jgi:predicted MFS family arabinose efflux permease
VSSTPKSETTSQPIHAAPRMSGALIFVFALGCGVAVANIYYVQPLLRVLGAEFHIGEGRAGMMVTVTQFGYACGLILLVPLLDLIENRKLIGMLFAGSLVGLIGAALSGSLRQFLAASLVIGMTSVVAQTLVPFAAHLAPPEIRGRIVGQVMTGLFNGIILARAFAGLISGAFGWRAVYWISAGMLVILIGILSRALPIRRPQTNERYGQLVRSLARIYRTEPVLRRRGIYTSCMFAAFTAFWTSITFLLSGPHFRLSQTQIGLFALAGALGAAFAPVAGWMADRGLARTATVCSFTLAVLSLGLTLLLQDHLWALVVGAILLDLAVNTTLVLGQQAIYQLNPEQRGRINTLYIATFFAGGVTASGLSGFAYAAGGWRGVVLLASAFPIAAFLFWLTEGKNKAHHSSLHARSV